MTTAAALYEQSIKQQVKSLPIAEQLQLADIIKQGALSKRVANAEEDVQQTDIMDLHGLGREIWQGVDAQIYVNSLRDEWQ